MDRLSWKSLTWERRKSDLREVSFTPPIPLHTSKSAMFWESRVGYKECEAVFPACNGHVVFFCTFYDAIPTIILLVYHFKECSLFLSSTLRVHCVTSGCCLFIACHWYIAIVFSASSLSSCFNSPVIVRARLCLRQHCCVDEGRRGESKGRSLACTAQAKHLGCGRFFADQTLCQVKDKKEKKMRTGTGQQNLAGSPRTLRAFI